MQNKIDLKNFLSHNLVCCRATAEIYFIVLTWLCLLASPLATSKKLVMTPSLATPLLAYCLEGLVDEIFGSRENRRVGVCGNFFPFWCTQQRSISFPSACSILERPAIWGHKNRSNKTRSLELRYQTEIYHCSFSSLYWIHPWMSSIYAPISSINPCAFLPPSNSQWC